MSQAVSSEAAEPRSVPNQPITVAYQGVEGANGEIAARGLAPGARPVPYPTFHEVLSAVAAGEVDLGVLPVENSLAGTVLQAVDLLQDTDLHIVRELVVRIRYGLMVLPSVQLEDLRRVSSHPQALAQCDGFIAKHHLEPVVHADTAGAAADLLKSGRRDEAAIAPIGAAQLYGLTVLASGIEDEPFNFTRFLVLSRHEPPESSAPHKTSIVFAVRHTPGFLLETLNQLRGFNLTKIESRPRRDRAWSYLIYIDLEGDARDPQVALALAGVLRKASYAKIIGSYPMAQGVIEP